ncbi:MAG: glycosyltransferase [Thermoanaerobaculia bacterium]
MRLDPSAVPSAIAARGAGARPSVSLCLVSYNSVSRKQLSREVIEALGEFVAQFPAEVVIVDNASTDDSATLLGSWAEPFAGLVVTSVQPAIPIVDATALAAAKAKGDHLFLLDPDEAMEALRLPELLEARRGVQVVHGVRSRPAIGWRGVESALFNLWCRATGFRMRDFGHHHYLLERSTFGLLVDLVQRHGLPAHAFAIELLRLSFREVEVSERPRGESSYSRWARFQRGAGACLACLRVRRLRRRG